MNEANKYRDALNHIIRCDRDDGHSYLSDAYRNDLDCLLELIKMHEESETNKNKDELTMHIMHGYDTLEAPTGKACFGCYINGEYEAYIADNIPTDQLIHTIAHEYFHYLQDIEGLDFSEEEADAFGFSIFTPSYKQGLADAIEAIEEELSISSDEFEKIKCKLLGGTMIK